MSYHWTAFLADDVANPDREINCGHRHKTEGAAFRCAKRLHYRPAAIGFAEQFPRCGGHPAIHIAAPWGKRVQIDKGIVDLIRLVWDAGIITTCSCEDFQETSNVQIIVASQKDADLFLGIVSSHRNITLTPMPAFGGVEITFPKSMLPEIIEKFGGK